MNRRRFTSLGLTSAGAAWTQVLLGSVRTQGPSDRYFYVAAVADSHIIDPMYHGHEDTAEDTESLFHTSARLIAARDALNAFQPRIEPVIHLGDRFHDYPSSDYDFYFKQSNCVDAFKTIMDGFHAPNHLLLGNHD